MFLGANLKYFLDFENIQKMGGDSYRPLSTGGKLLVIGPKFSLISAHKAFSPGYNFGPLIQISPPVGYTSEKVEGTKF